MLFITFSSLWSVTFFFTLTYLTFILSVVTYLLPLPSLYTKYTHSKNQKNSSLLNSFDVFWVVVTPYILIVLLTNLWVLPATSAWFGHLVISNFQMKVLYLILFSFMLVTGALFSTLYFSSREVYDYIITTYSFCYWLILLFMANSIFSVVFIIEVISTLILLLIVTSVFSTAFFYRNLNLSFGHIIQQTTPYTYLQSLLYFFWVSLISSLNLFLFFLLLYTKLLTLDWFLLEYIFTYFVTVSNVHDIMSVGLYWLIMLFCIFLKCGVAPLFLWKPTFFKGIPVYTLFFYICFFYFFLFIFFIYFLTVYFAEIFYFFNFITLTFVLFGLIILLGIVCESFYLKIFMAISSILNSLFVLLTLTSNHVTELYFWL